VTSPAVMAALDAALFYVARGWPVFPVHSVSDGRCTCGRYPCGDGNRSAGKHPRSARGCLDATLDADVVRRWWERWPDASVGIATGGRLAVLDVDPGHGGGETLDGLLRSLCALPETCEVLTGGGGRHLYLEVPEGASVRCSVGQLGPGLDVRGEGGYVVAPPSAHLSGRSYEWEASSDPADGVALGTVPNVWLRAMGPARARSTGHGQTVEPEAFPEGQRNDGLFRLGRSLRSKGLSSAAILAALEAENEARCVPPLEGDEVRRIAESVCRVAPGQSPEYRPRERVESAAATTGADEGDGDPGPVEPRQDTVTGGSWADELRRTETGLVRATFGNICAILRHSPEYAEHLRYNRMRLAVDLSGTTLEDWDVGHVREAIEKAWDFSPSADNLRAALLTVASERAYHPVQAYLEGLTWDGEARIDRIAREILHAVSDYEEGVDLATIQVHAWLTSAVARVFEPGCKVDTALILVGAQGWYKSSFFRVLAGQDWFSDSPIDLGNKDALLQLHDTWIYEWPEVEVITSRREAGQVKAFMASQVDLFRAPFRAAVSRVPRTNVIVGTTNEPRFLEDPTGSRRFWVVTCGSRVDVETLREWRDQLWAEAVVHYRAHEQYHLPDDAEAARARVAESHRSCDPWEPVVAAWLRSREDTTRPLTSSEVLRRALDVLPAQQHRGHENRCGAVLRALGYTSRRQRVPEPWRAEIGQERAWIWTPPEGVVE